MTSIRCWVGSSLAIVSIVVLGCSGGESNEQEARVFTSVPPTSRDAPLAVGATGTITMDDRTFTATLMEVSTEEYRDQPTRVSYAEGNGPLLAKVKVHFEEDGGGTTQLDSGDFNAISSAGLVYRHPQWPGWRGFIPHPALDFDVFSPATVEGWLRWTVQENDPALVMVFGANNELKGGIWFSLVK